MKAKRMIITATVLLLFVGAIALWPRDNEPSYNGKKLSQWIDSYSGQVNVFRSLSLEEINQPAPHAVRSIGTNALPCLLDWIRYEPAPSKAKQFLRRTLQRLRLRVWDDPAEVRAERATIGFAMLGPVASPAIPELSRLAANARNKDLPGRAIYALVGIGPNSLPALTELIRSTNAVARYEAVQFLNGGIHKFGTNAFPILVECLDDRDAKVALEAADALAEVGAEPALVCVKMRTFLQHPEWSLRFRALATLGDYRGEARLEARAIVPELVATLADTNWIVRVQAESILRKVAPEVLTNAPAR